MKANVCLKKNIIPFASLLGRAEDGWRLVEWLMRLLLPPLRLVVEAEFCRNLELGSELSVNPAIRLLGHAVIGNFKNIFRRESL